VCGEIIPPCFENILLLYSYIAVRFFPFFLKVMDRDITFIITGALQSSSFLSCSSLSSSHTSYSSSSSTASSAGVLTASSL
jgi:hypothetical protein